MPRSFCLPILAGAALGLATSTAGQQPTFRSMVDAVRVDVRVTGGSGAVRGLSARDFEVRDNGVIQRVDIVSYDQAPLRLLLALDVSASVQGHRLAALVDGCGAIVDQLQPSDLVSLIVFNHGLSRRVGPDARPRAGPRGAGRTCGLRCDVVARCHPRGRRCRRCR